MNPLLAAAIVAGGLALTRKRDVRNPASSGGTAGNKPRRKIDQVALRMLVFDDYAKPIRCLDDDIIPNLFGLGLIEYRYVGDESRLHLTPAGKAAAAAAAADRGSIREWLDERYDDAVMIGAGSFGIAYKITPKKGKPYALKASNSSEEFRCVQRIKGMKGEPGLPKIKAWGPLYTSDAAYWYTREYLSDVPPAGMPPHEERRLVSEVFNRLHALAFQDLNDSNYGWRGRQPVFFDYLCFCEREP